jgi:hypothetical protein
MKYVVAASPGPMSLAVDVEIESTDTTIKRCTQALIDCGATGCFIDIEWAKLNNIPTHPLTWTRMRLMRRCRTQVRP